MGALSERENERRKTKLFKTYASVPQFGFVLGAGVTVASHVPAYRELALRILENAAGQPDFAGSRKWARTFVEDQRTQPEAQGELAIPPEELSLVVRSHIGGSRSQLRNLVCEALYKKVRKEGFVGRIVRRKCFEQNPTLDAVITFCAAGKGSAIASGSDYEVVPNRKVGAMLTTNYDNLVEGSYHTKYRLMRLKPVGRPTSREWLQPKNLQHAYVIPVFHIHGYVGYLDTKPEAQIPQNPSLVIAQDDYFRVFYDPLSFGNYVSMNFFRRYPSLFIGSKLTDQNLRRYLFHLARETGNDDCPERRFAILRRSDSVKNQLTDTALKTYGVEVIWIDGFSEIPEILKGMYVSADGVDEDDWNYVQQYRWDKQY